MRGKNRNSIARIKNCPQFTTMNVIDGQAGLIICASLFFHSLTIDNILNIIVLLILAGVSIAVLTGENGILNRATSAKQTHEEKTAEEELKLGIMSLSTDYYSKTTRPATFRDFVFTAESQADLNKYLSGTATFNTTNYTITYKNAMYQVDENGGITKIEDIGITPKPLNLQIVDAGTERETKDSKDLTAVLSGISGQVSWEITAGSDKVSINPSTGETISVTPKATGSATIKATCSGKEATCTVTVESVTSVEVTFNLNGGSVDNSTNSITNRYLPGEPITLPVPTAPSDTPNYKLKGWYDNQAGTGNPVIAKSETSISAPNSNTTYYAQWDESLTYGATANLGTVQVNGTNLLRNWKYFYNDGANIYLIYDYYLENSQIPESTENGIATDGYNVYVDTTNYSEKTRQNLVDYLNNESTSTSGIWSGFAAGVQTALSNKGITATVKAKGAPTLEQFAGSYQANYPGDEFDVAYRQAGGYRNGVNGSTVNVEGYVYKKGSDWFTAQNLGNSNKLLYFPEVNKVRATGGTADTNGYWLARSLC